MYRRGGWHSIKGTSINSPCPHLRGFFRPAEEVKMLLRCLLRCNPRRNKDLEHCSEVELHGISAGRVPALP